MSVSKVVLVLLLSVSLLSFHKILPQCIMLSEVFWVAFIGTLSGCIIKLASMAYKSKCKEFQCCCLKVIRDIEAEEREDQMEQIPKSEKADNA